VPYEKSAGVVVVRDGKYLLLHYEGGHWDFAKGHVEKGETEEIAALRELKEETALEGEIIPGFSHKIHYFFNRGKEKVSKDVVFFIAKVKGAKVILSDEHVGFDWLPIEDALKKLTYDTAKDVLRKAKNWLDGHDDE